MGNAISTPKFYRLDDRPNSREFIMETILLTLHITTGTFAIITGFITLFLVKGSKWHVNTGRAFNIAMLVTAASISGLGAYGHNIDDILGGVMIMYFIISAWRSLKFPKVTLNRLDVGLFVVILSLTLANLALGYQAGKSVQEFPPALYYITATILFIAVLDDIYLFIKRGAKGNYRVIRHSWRMCLVLFIAAGSFFLGQMKVFPQIIIEKMFYLLFIPPILPILALIYWVIRLNIKTYPSKRKAPLKVDNEETAD